MTDFITANNVEPTNLIQIEIYDDLSHLPEQPTTREVCKSLFLPCFICQARIHQSRHMQDLLRQRAADAYSTYSIAQFDVETQERLKQSIAKPISAKNPLFYIGEHKIFKDVRTKEECQIIRSNSLPHCFEYFLPVEYKKKLVCLDLDETLIRSVQNCQNGDEDFNINVELQDKTLNFAIIKRPHLHEFLTKLSQQFDICIFTYAIQEYADQVIDNIDVNKVVKYRLYRQHCIRMDVDDTGNKFIIIKDLTRIGRSMDDIVLVDNSKKTGYWQENNFLLVSSFLGDRSDNLLPNLLGVLLRLGQSQSIYEELKNSQLK